MVATSRNQRASIRFRGIAIEEMNRKTKKTGNRLWTASPEPVRSAAKMPSAPKASVISDAEHEQHEDAADPGREADAEDQPDDEVDERLEQRRA